MGEILSISCPYCGETIEVEPEEADHAVQYVEDCSVCCRPILLTVVYSEEGSQITAERENG